MRNATIRRFRNVCERVGVDDQRVRMIFRELKDKYSEPSRTYHNLSHIERMLSWLDEIGGGSDAVELAIWFHDAVYDPSGSQNEVESARYFRKHLQGVVKDGLLEDVERLILATDPSRVRSEKEDEQQITDIDLSILGSAPEDYDAYRRGIRCEYSFVPAADFAHGRRSILESFLSRPIFSTSFFSKLEQQARDNISNELKSL